MNIKHSIACSLLTIVLSCTGSIANALIITNGSFEDGSFTNTASNYMALNSGDTALTGWQINSQVAWGVNPTDPYSASHGAGFIDLSSFSANSLGGMQQSLNTVAGTTYNFSIDRLGGSIEVLLDGSTLLSTSDRPTNWSSYTASFTATSTSTVLSIRNIAPGDPIVFIDNIVITGPGNTVDEPGILWLLMIGIPGLVIRNKKTRDKFGKKIET